MKNKKTKVYIYTRVSTATQVEGYSLEAQRDRIQKYADAFDYVVAGFYEDAGKSGKAIEGRTEFKAMLEDIESNKDDISYVLVFKLSRFGRNAADVLGTLQCMQDVGVNLICIDDGIDSSKDAGKLMISVLSAVAEIERENILVQTMEGRIRKAKNGEWNGGTPPYGYQLQEGKLEIKENEAEDIRLIFNKYVNTEMGANGVAKYLAQQGIEKKKRKNSKNDFFTANFIRRILDNPVYSGRVAFGRTRSESVKGSREKTRIVKQDDYMVFDGIHEAIIDEETWGKTLEKRKQQAKRYEHVFPHKDAKTHLLTGILRCPICDTGMYGNKSIKNKNGKHYKDYFYYGCKHRNMMRGYKCDYSKQLGEEKLDSAVAEVISKLVSNPKFANMMKDKINIKTDTIEIEKEIGNYRKQLGQYIGTKRSLERQVDSLDYEDRHYDRKFSDLQDRLDTMYDRIEDIEKSLKDCKDRKKSIEAEQLTSENIYKILIHFDRLYNEMEDIDKRTLLTALIKEIHVYEEAKANGQWLKSIVFKLPIIEGDMKLGLDNGACVEVIALIVKK